MVVVGMVLLGCADDPPAQDPPLAACSPTISYWTARCRGGTAETGLFLDDVRVSSHSYCGVLVEMTTATCVGGCSEELDTIQRAGAPLAAGVAQVLRHPEVLCMETAEAEIGDPCDDARPCLPTRATLDADGNVTGQTYLACIAGTCQQAAPPMTATGDRCIGDWQCPAFTRCQRLGGSVAGLPTCEP